MNQKTLSFSLLVLLCACASPSREEPVMADPDAMAQVQRSFQSAWEELHQAIGATPSWQTRPESAIRVQGLADLAIYRSEKLRPFVAQGLISHPVIDLMQQEVRRTALLDNDRLPKTEGTFLEPAEGQLVCQEEESAWHRIWRRIELLEAFATAGRSTPWLNGTVLPAVFHDLKIVNAASLESALQWRRVIVTPESFAEDQARMRTLQGNLQALTAGNS